LAQHTVLKPFSYAPDGLRTLRVAVGEVLEDIDVAYVAGLLSEGYIAEGVVEVEPPGTVTSTETGQTGERDPPEPPTPAPAPVDFDAMTDAELRAFLKDRDGTAPHHMTGRPKLLAAARGE
jgi:hypothetical protein